MEFLNDPEIAALMRESATGEEELTMPKGPKASAASIDYAISLIERVHSLSVDDYSWDDMTQEEVSELIDECKMELNID